eukprot:3208193-Amphidinium_carterae.1
MEVEVVAATGAKSAELMFDVLGWNVASGKLSDMGSAFVALSAVVDLAGAPERVEVANTPGRVQDLVTELESVLRENSLKRHEVERLRANGCSPSCSCSGEWPDSPERS